MLYKVNLQVIGEIQATTGGGRGGQALMEPDTQHADK